MRRGDPMQSRWLYSVLGMVALLLATVVGASAQGDRFVGVRKDVSEEVVLFSIDALSGTERKIATLHKADANVQLLGLTALNARRGTFSYAYTDRAAGKDFLHTVSAINGATVSLTPLPADVSGLQIVADTGRPHEDRMRWDALQRRIEYLEQEVRRLKSEVRR
jgi:hypothetical protein